jgi:hypothetical protein
MPVKIQFGDLFLAPTETEQGWAAVGAGVAAVGFLVGSASLKTIGLLAVAGVAWSVYEEAQTFTDPDTMNGFFQTDGEYSATTGGKADARALRGMR